jgi:urease accessory protein
LRRAARARAAPAAFAIALVPGPAAAHGALTGVGEVYAGLLHPLIVPGELLALLALALALATSGRAACRVGLPALALGLAAGLGFGALLPADLATPVLLAVAFAAAGPVVLGLRLPRLLAAVLAIAAGLAVGADAMPEATALSTRLSASVATIVGGAAFVTLVVGVALGRERHWQRVAARVAASWIMASAILYLAWFAFVCYASFGPVDMMSRATLNEIELGEETFEEAPTATSRSTVTRPS